MTGQSRQLSNETCSILQETIQTLCPSAPCNRHQWGREIVKATLAADAVCSKSIRKISEMSYQTIAIPETQP